VNFKLTPQIEARSNYLGVYGTGSIPDVPGPSDGMFTRNSSLGMRDLRDGSSYILAVGERSSKLAYATWSARVPGGYLYNTSATSDGTTVPPGVPGCSMVLAPVGIVDAPRTPNNGTGHPEDFSSGHTGGVNFLFADSSVRFVKDSISQRVFLSLATRDGGEVVSDDQY
jgi:prepilin-type processing-associated H-X9-DG protein